MLAWVLTYQKRTVFKLLSFLCFILLKFRICTDNQWHQKISWQISDFFYLHFWCSVFLGVDWTTSCYVRKKHLQMRNLQKKNTLILRTFGSFKFKWWKKLTRQKKNSHFALYCQQLVLYSLWILSWNLTTLNVKFCIQQYCFFCSLTGNNSQ